MQLEQRVRWEQDALGDLLIYDCSNNTAADVLPLYHAFHGAVLSKPAGTVRVLADFENAVHSAEITKMYKDAHEVHDRQVRKFAALGVTGGMKIVFAAYRFFARLKGLDVDLKMRIFEDEAQGRAWLAES